MSTLLQMQSTKMLNEQQTLSIQLLKEDQLSKREHQVLDLIGNGLTSDEISSKLFISTNTVISHRKNMQRKMHARNSTHLVFLACKLGLL